MDRVILQVPMSRSVKEAAEAVSTDYGFSSLQEIIRVLINKLSRRELVVSVSLPKEERLSAKAEKRYIKMLADIDKNKNVSKTKNLDEFFRLLNT